MTCDKCGSAVSVGEWPWCPHGFGLPNVIDDQLEGGPRLFETMGPQDVWIESKSQWRREVAARELVHVDRHDRAYYTKRLRMHDEALRDTGRA
jgi:hypothetical protein